MISGTLDYSSYFCTKFIFSSSSKNNVIDGFGFVFPKLRQYQPYDSILQFPQGYKQTFSYLCKIQMFRDRDEISQLTNFHTFTSNNEWIYSLLFYYCYCANGSSGTTFYFNWKCTKFKSMFDWYLIKVC